MIIPVFGLNSVEEYLERREEIDKKIRPTFCPGCKARSSFWRHGRYARKVLTEQSTFVVQINRFRCRNCHLTVSCIFSFLVPYSHFSLKTIAKAVQYSVDVGGTYLQQSTELSELSDNQSLKPSANQIFKWVNLLAKKSAHLHFHLQKEQLMRNIDVHLNSSLGSSTSLKVKTRSADKDGKLKELTLFVRSACSFFNDASAAIEKVHAFFFCKVEALQAFFCERALKLPTPHSSISLNF